MNPKNNEFGGKLSWTQVEKMKTETSNKTRGRGHLETSRYIANICQERTDENVPGK